MVVVGICAEEEARNDYHPMALAIKEEGYIEGFLQVGVLIRSEQAQEAVEHVDLLLVVVTVFAREALYVACYQDEEVEGGGVDHRATQVKEEPNLGRASNPGTAR